MRISLLEFRGIGCTWSTGSCKKVDNNIVIRIQNIEQFMGVAVGIFNTKIYSSIQSSLGLN